MKTAIANWRLISVSAAPTLVLLTGCLGLNPGLPSPKPTIAPPPIQPQLSTITSTFHANLNLGSAASELCSNYSGSADFDTDPLSINPFTHVWGHLDYQIWPRDEESDASPRIYVTDHGIRVSGKFQYQIRGRFSTSSILLPLCVIHPCPFQCGQDGEYPRHLDVSSDLRLKIDPKWFVRIENRPEVHSQDCKVTARGIDIASRVETGLHSAMNRAVDKASQHLKERTDIYEKAKLLWPTFFDPMDLGDGTFATLNPVAVSVSPMRSIPGTPPAVEWTIGFTAFPSISFGVQGHSANTTDLPDITESQNIDDKFHVFADVSATFPYLEDQLNTPKLRKLSFEFGKHSLSIEHVSLSGYGSQILTNFSIGTDVRPYTYPNVVDVWSGSEYISLHIADGFLRLFFKSKGNLMAVATPTISTSNNMITFPDLQYTLETDNALADSAAWIVRDDIQEQLRKLVVFDASKSLAVEGERLDQFLNRKLGKHATLKGHIERLDISDLYVLDDRISIRTKASGYLTVQTDWLK